MHEDCCGLAKVNDSENLYALQNEIAVRAGETILLPAITQEVTIVPEDGGVKLLETYLLTPLPLVQSVSNF